MDPSNGRIHISRHVAFNEQLFPFVVTHSSSSSSSTSSDPLVIFGPLQKLFPQTQLPGLHVHSTNPIVVSTTASIPPSVPSNPFAESNIFVVHDPHVDHHPVAQRYVPCDTHLLHGQQVAADDTHLYIPRETHLEVAPATPLATDPQPSSIIPSMSPTHHLAHPAAPSTNENFSLPPTCTYPMQTRSQSGIFKKKPWISTLHLLPQALLSQALPPEPTSYTQAAKSSNWRDAIDQEFTTLQRQGTWTLVPHEPHMNVVGCN